MKIHWLQHVPFEGLGCIEPWLLENGHEVSCTRLFKAETLPDPREVDGLIVMGGPMGVDDETVYPWLADEKASIKEIIAQDKPVLGICLGAQLIAAVLGAPVTRSKHLEIGFFECRASSLSAEAFGEGWIPLAFLPSAENDRDGRSTFRGGGEIFPETFPAFHWHGDTFGIPEGATPLASSEACENQAFIYNNKVLALQFHLETTEESLCALYEHCAHEITDGPFVQRLPALRSLGEGGEEMKPFFPELGKCNALMFGLLNRLF